MDGTGPIIRHRKTDARADRAARRAGAGTPKPPTFTGWRTSDAEEIERRRWRGLSEIVSVEALDPAHPVFGDFRVRSTGSGNAYTVEIRSLSQPLNACDCHDFRVNGLGTCKHIEGTLAALKRKRKGPARAAAEAGSPRVEVYLAPGPEPQATIAWPTAKLEPGLARLLAGAGLPPGTERLDEPAQLLARIDRLLGEASPDLRALIRVSARLRTWVADRERRAERAAARARFAADLAANRESLDLLKAPLLPYQREGALHLAFGERALLADEMGLGKTIQAIAACALLHRLRGIRRVLVVMPASLKGEWAEQITRFTDLPWRIIGATRARRLLDYREESFFYLANYEQVLTDATTINEVLRPDVVILDEAQRIKNWQTKTASAVKRLRSPYAFVLTGTPLENRIDEVYSIGQYLDPDLIGPLFRFNRDFYELDERGRPVDYKNLAELNRRLKPLMLRRRKSDVDEQLPERTVKTYFIQPSDEQRLRYQEFERPAAALVARASRRPLTRAEFDRLQQLLACMRMICDTPFILDSNCRDCPKLDELERILVDLLEDPAKKIIIFSEWERMLELVRGLAGELGIDIAWHTGSVPQDKRRIEITRFKKDPACRLLLSTDSGSVGLNLQAASAVINLDLPWNPAKYEQRIARAWRKHQQRSVSVINLVTEGTIEHRMLSLLAQKQDLAEGVLDGRGDLSQLKMPSGRAALVERLASMMAPPPTVVPAAPASLPPADPLDRVLATTLATLGQGLLLLEEWPVGSEQHPILAVIEDRQEAAARTISEALARESACAAAPIEIIDRSTLAHIQRLVAAGILRFAEGTPRALHRSPALNFDLAQQERRRRRAEAERELTEAERKLRMSRLLHGGGFAAESLGGIAESLRLAIGAAENLASGASDTASDDAERLSKLVAAGLLPGEVTATAAALATIAPEAEEVAAEMPLGALIDSLDRTVVHLRASLDSAS